MIIRVDKKEIQSFINALLTTFVARCDSRAFVDLMLYTCF